MGKRALTLAGEMIPEDTRAYSVLRETTREVMNAVPEAREWFCQQRL